MVYFLPPTVLVILDGFGYNKYKEHNAIALAHKPHFDYLLKNYPWKILAASGIAVGLPEGMMGNSEVGHLTIGSGRIIEQDNTRISEAIKNGNFFLNPILKDHFLTFAKTNKTLHIIGLLSDAGVHSEQSHLYAFLKAAQENGIKKTVVHAILDGRDVAPISASLYLTALQEYMHTNKYGVIGSLHGRFYAMDRDNNWERIAAIYHALTQKQEITFDSWCSALDYYYADKIYDEFIPPTPLIDDAIIQDGDAVVFFNFRPDRARQLTEAFTALDFNGFKRKKIDLAFFMTPVSYDDAKVNIVVLYKKKLIQHTLMEVLASVGKTMFAIAETEKYAHVTYFFNGGNEKVLNHETRILIPSLPAKNYIKNPEMSAAKITEAVIHSLHQDPKNFYLINYANADMVGHSGNEKATIQAIECLDQQIGMLYQVVVKEMHGTLYITADHGNAEQMYDEATKQPKTSHTTNPVYFIMVQEGLEHQPLPCSNMQGLSDIAPCILQNMKLPVPNEMKK